MTLLVWSDTLHYKGTKSLTVTWPWRITPGVNQITACVRPWRPQSVLFLHGSQDSNLWLYLYFEAPERSCSDVHIPASKGRTRLISGGGGDFLYFVFISFTKIICWKILKQKLKNAETCEAKRIEYIYFKTHAIVRGILSHGNFQAKRSYSTN